jgi:hypothetical protein
MVISLIPHLHGHVFESARVSGNFYLNCWNEKMKGKEKKKKNRLEEEQSEPAPTVVPSPSSSQASY